ncbi:MAG TPA: VOC family protein [Acidobacteriaceae bacterium]|nr:VOC family protein [Acidobacteriaceae bacterium]
MKVLFVTGFGPIVRQPAEDRRLFRDVLGIRFKEESNGYLHTEALDGVKTFALWPLSQAAQSCFGTDTWPVDIPAPQAWLEFDVDSVEQASAELESQGYRLLVKNRKEPWGQTVSRLLAPDGLLIGISYTPVFREAE